MDTPSLVMDGFLVGATIAGPILAVRAQKIVESLTQRQGRKLQIFKTLMATRAARLSSEHVQALNMIDIEFSGFRLLRLFRYQSAKEKRVIAAWRIYLDILSENVEGASESVATDWNSRSFEQFIEVLYVLSIALGYDFDKVHLKRGIYSPRAHGTAEAAQLTIRDSLARILSGQQSIPMAVTQFPYSQETVDLQHELQLALLSSLKGEKPLKVSLEGTVNPPDDAKTLQHTA